PLQLYKGQQGCGRIAPQDRALVEVGRSEGALQRLEVGGLRVQETIEVGIANMPFGRMASVAADVSDGGFHPVALAQPQETLDEGFLDVLPEGISKLALFTQFHIDSESRDAQAIRP